MNLKVLLEDYNRSPAESSEFCLGEGNQVIFEVSDDFVRDLNILLNPVGKNQTNYTTMLINLIFKADNYNWKKLHKIYPAETFTIWCYKNVLGFAEQLKI